jgi:DtxR family Mn-dependent transcriptional regulator
VSDLIDTTEMYLRTIYELEEEGIVPLRARIAQRLSQSGPTVSQTVARMERAGLVVVTDDRTLQLTGAGRSRAVSVMRKHRLAERLLVDVIGLPWEYVHEEACRWEHVMSDRVERRIDELLGHPTESPYGNPIPGAAASGPDGAWAGEDFRAGLLPLSSVAGPSPVVVQVRRLGEPAQTDPESMALLAEVGLAPGGTVGVTRPGRGRVLVTSTDGQHAVELDDELAAHVFVVAPDAERVAAKV